jgi:hypothetical protein
MIKGYKITNEQKENVKNKKYTNDSYFNPIQDIDGNWLLSIEEIIYCNNEEFEWFKDLELIEYKPIEYIQETYIN